MTIEFPIISLFFTMHMKKIAFYLSVLSIIVALTSCNADLEKTTSEEFKQTITGEAQGTTWRIVYYDLQERNFKYKVDSILKRVDESVSTYLSNSVIDQWNKSDSGAYIDHLFFHLLSQSWEVYEASNGAFDPTVKPLVSYWGFGPERFEHPELVDQHKIDSLLELVNFDTLRIIRNKGSFGMSELKGSMKKTDKLFLTKPIPGMQLDFNAIGQGWSVDQVVKFLEAQELKLFFVEIGGEISVGYPKPDGSLWRFGIDKPIDENAERELQAVVKLRNKGLATSGNYRKFYEKNGARYSHTIDPTTGYPVKHNLLSATVVSKNAGLADAYATAFMVMGMDSSILFIEEHDYLSNFVYLIASDEEGNYKTFTSKQLESAIDLEE